MGWLVGRRCGHRAPRERRLLRLDSPGASTAAFLATCRIDAGCSPSDAFTPRPSTQRICRIVTRSRARRSEGFMTVPCTRLRRERRVPEHLGADHHGEHAASNAQIAPSLNRNLAAAGPESYVRSRHGSHRPQTMFDESIVGLDSVWQTIAVTPKVRCRPLQHLQRVQRQCELDTQHQLRSPWRNRRCCRTAA